MVIVAGGIGAYWIYLESERGPDRAEQIALNQALCEAALDRRLAVEADLARWVPLAFRDYSYPLSLAARADPLELFPLVGEAKRLEGLLVEAVHDINETCLIPTGRPTATPLPPTPTPTAGLLRVRPSGQ